MTYLSPIGTIGRALRICSFLLSSSATNREVGISMLVDAGGRIVEDTSGGALRVITGILNGMLIDPRGGAVRVVRRAVGTEPPGCCIITGEMNGALVDARGREEVIVAGRTTGAPNFATIVGALKGAFTDTKGRLVILVGRGSAAPFIGFTKGALRLPWIRINGGSGGRSSSGGSYTI